MERKRDRGVVGGARRTAAPLADSRLSPIRVLQFACWSRIGTTALTVVRPTTESISSCPPICSKRSRMLANPTPPQAAAALPLALGPQEERVSLSAALPLLR